jgi:hypothetical protein
MSRIEFYSEFGDSYVKRNSMAGEEKLQTIKMSNTAIFLLKMM